VSAEPEAIEPMAPPAAVMYRLGGRTYPAEVDQGCLVCKSTYRAMVENWLVQGRSYAASARALPSDAMLSPRDISRHVRGHHLPLAEDVRRQIVEDRGGEIGRDPETHAGALGDHITMLRLGVNDVMERMVSRDIEPTISEGIQMARILTAVDQHGEETEREDNSRVQVAAIRAILTLVRQALSDEQYRTFSAQVVADPLVRQLMSTPAESPAPTITVGAP
jgi:hypothetical protein